MTSDDQVQNLFKSIKQGKGNRVQSLLEEGCDPDVCRRNTPALIFAVVENKIRCVEILIKYNVSIDKRDLHGKTAAMFACTYNRRDILSLLFNAGSKMNLTSQDGMTASMYAAQHQNPECLSFILGCPQINLNQKDLQGNTAIMHAVTNDSTECLQFLANQGADINLINNQGQCPLLKAIYVGNFRIADFLIETGASINIQDNSGYTPLSTALEFIGHSSLYSSTYEDYRLIEKLLLKEARPNLEMSKSSYLHKMIIRKQSKIVRLMVFNGFRPVLAECISEECNFDIHKPLSPLSVALLTDSVDIAKYLLANSFLTYFDVSELPNDKDIYERLSHNSYDKCLALIKSMFTSPLHLVTLSFITVSDFSQILKRRQSCERYIEYLPTSIQEKLLFKTKTALLCPSTWENLPLDFSQNCLYGCQNLLSFWPLGLGSQLIECKCVLCSKSPGYKPWLVSNNT